MEYLLLIYEDERNWVNKTEAELEPAMDGHRRFLKEFAGMIKGGNALKPTSEAKTVRLRSGKPLSIDGPFAETKEQLGGYYLVDATSLEDVIRAAAKLPEAVSGSIEVRPILKHS